MRPTGVLVIALVVVLSGCGEDRSSEPACPTTIAGSFLLCGQPLRGVVDAVPFGVGVVARDSTDAFGAFALEVLPGRYRLRTSGTYWDAGTGFSLNYYYSSAGTVSAEESAEVIEVSGHGPALRADFALGAVDLRLSANPDLGDRLSFRVGIANWSASMRLLDSERYWLRVDAVDSPRPTRFVVEPGVYSLSALYDLPQYAESWWLNRDPGSLEPEAIVVTGTEPVVYDIRLEDVASLEGHVRGSWERMRFTPPVIEAFQPDGARIRSTWVSDYGAYRLDLFVARPVRLRLTIDTGITSVAQWIGGTDSVSAALFPMRPGEVIEVPDIVESGLEIVLAPPTPGETFVPELGLRDESGRAVDLKVVSKTADIFPIANLRPGRYLLHVDPKKPGWAAQWYDRAASPDSADWIEVAGNGEITRVAVQLERGVDH